MPGSHFEGEYSPIFQNQTVGSSVPDGSLSPRSPVRVREGGRLLLRPQSRRAEGLDDAARAR